MDVMTVCDICGKVFCAICFEKAWGVIYCATCEQTNNAQHCESRIIDLAKRHNGRLTSKEVASESEMPLIQAKVLLMQLDKKRLCHSELDPYVF